MARPLRASESVSAEISRNLALELVRVTEAGALASARWMGRGDKNTADGAAVDAMRRALGMIPMDGVVVIGEGEKDEAPMLYIGEQIGTGDPPQVDVAVDPIDGTTLLSKGRSPWWRWPPDADRSTTPNTSTTCTRSQPAPIPPAR